MIVDISHSNKIMVEKFTDTGDTRETPVIDMCLGLLGDKAVVSIYDPQVRRDLAMNKFDWDHAHPRHLPPVGRGRARRAARHRHVGRVRGRPRCARRLHPDRVG
ncbi:hypothetical protein VPH35_059779 [Triticum aestivum]